MKPVLRKYKALWYYPVFGLLIIVVGICAALADDFYLSLTLRVVLLLTVIAWIWDRRRRSKARNK